MYKKSQSLSLEVIIAISLALFVTLSIVSYKVFDEDKSENSVLKKTQETKEKVTSFEKELVQEKVLNENYEIDLSATQNLNLTKIKEDLKITNEVSIYFEDEDGVILLNNEEVCFGELNISVNGFDCLN